jgi:hypothetical protein
VTDALYQVWICGERHAKGDQIRHISRDGRFGASGIIAAVENYRSTEGAPER